jgi:hypothetical protein
MTWTTTPPTGPNWYWMDEAARGDVQAVFVGFAPPGRHVKFSSCFAPDRRLDEVAPGTLWYGPVEPPEPR